MSKSCPKVVHELSKSGQKVVKKWSESGQKVVRNFSNSCPKVVQTWSESGPKVVINLSKSCPKVVQKRSESGQKIVQQFSKSCPKVVIATFPSPLPPRVRIRGGWANLWHFSCSRNMARKTRYGSISTFSLRLKLRISKDSRIQNVISNFSRRL